MATAWPIKSQNRLSAYAHAKLLLANNGQKHGIEKGPLGDRDIINLSIAQDENSFIVC